MKMAHDYTHSRALVSAVESSNDPVVKLLPKDGGYFCYANAIKDPELKTKVLTHYEDFMKQREFKDIGKYLEFQHNQEFIKIQITFLSIFGVPTDDLLSANQPVEYLKSCSHNFFFEEARKVYGCKEAKWNPENGIDELIQQIKENGPLLIRATMGRSCYVEEPKKLSETIEGRSIYGWPPNSPRREIAHVVILVGARKDDKGNSTVYYIDPNDPSEPYQPGTQKVYKGSYKRLIEGLSNVISVPFAARKQLEEIHLNYPYAWHM